MNLSTLIRVASSAAIAAAVAGFFAWAGGRWGDGSVSWIAVLPPLVAVTMAIATRKLLASLLMGVLIGGFLAADAEAPIVPQGLRTNWGFFTAVYTDSYYQLVLVFVACMLPMITVTLSIGGLQRLLYGLAARSAGRWSAQFFTAILGLLIFIDDYANTMLIGTTMQPMTDRYRVSREKLAFLVDATAAPVAGVALMSTWIGHEVGLLGAAFEGTGRQGYDILLDILPLRFYCLLMIAFVFLQILLKREFGSMLAAEVRAAKHGQLWAADAKRLGSASHENRIAKTNGAVVAAGVPIAVLFVIFLAGLWITGGGAELTEWSGANIRQVVASANSTLVLAVASSAAMLAAICSAVAMRVPMRRIGSALRSGVIAALLPMAVLVLAWMLKASCDAVQTGEFLKMTFARSMPAMWFPLVVFLLACFTAFATGTSWGTMSILIPAIAPLAVSLDPQEFGMITLLSLAAVLDGAIFGDHCSPISDTTIMSSTASGCDHLHHVRTQMPYAMLVAAIAGLGGYLAMAMGMPILVPWLLGPLAIVVVLQIFGRTVPEGETDGDGVI